MIERIRVCLTFDQDVQPLQWAVTTYKGDYEHIGTHVAGCGPFDTPVEALCAALSFLDESRQLAIPYD